MLDTTTETNFSLNSHHTEKILQARESKPTMFIYQQINMALREYGLTGHILPVPPLLFLAISDISCLFISTC